MSVATPLVMVLTIWYIIDLLLTLHTNIIIITSWGLAGRYRICRPFLLFLDPEIAPFLWFLDPEIFSSIFTISGSRNCSISAVSGARNCTISTISGARNFLVHFHDFWIQKLQYFSSFWIQKLHHFYNFWIVKRRKLEKETTGTLNKLPQSERKKIEAEQERKRKQAGLEVPHSRFKIDLSAKKWWVGTD